MKKEPSHIWGAFFFLPENFSWQESTFWCNFEFCARRREMRRVRSHISTPLLSFLSDRPRERRCETRNLAAVLSRYTRSFSEMEGGATATTTLTPGWHDLKVGVSQGSPYKDASRRPSSSSAVGSKGEVEAVTQKDFISLRCPKL